MTDGGFDIGFSSSRQSQQAMVHFQRVFSNYVQTILRQQEINIVNSSSTRILDRQQSDVNFIVDSECLNRILGICPFIRDPDLKCIFKELTRISLKLWKDF